MPEWLESIILTVVASSSFWSMFGEVILHKLNKKTKLDEQMEQLTTQLNGLSDKLDKHIADSEKTEMDKTRYRIIEFGDRVRAGTVSNEHWDAVMKDIDDYEAYCVDHPDYPNNKAVLTIKRLKDEYAKGD